jgi:rare lipoprotein A
VLKDRRPYVVAVVHGVGMGSGYHSRVAEVIARSFALAGACVALANCGSSDKFAAKVDPRYGVASSARVVDFGEAVPKGGGTLRIGKPYQVAGRTYVPEDDRSYRTEGLASWYGSDFHGRRTANGEVYDMEGLSAAHPTLPLPSYIRVTNMRNQRSVILRVNDRGPFHGNRVVDVSKRAAHMLGFHGHGVARVRVEYVGPASLDGSDDHLLAATLREGEPAPAPSMVRLASSRPFLPQSDQRTTPLARDVPMPSDRPYSLGQDGDVAPQVRGRHSVAAFGGSRQEEQAATSPRTLNEQVRGFQDRFPQPDRGGLVPVNGSFQARSSLY